MLTVPVAPGFTDKPHAQLCMPIVLQCPAATAHVLTLLLRCCHCVVLQEDFAQVGLVSLTSELTAAASVGLNCSWQPCSWQWQQTWQALAGSCGCYRVLPFVRDEAAVSLAQQHPNTQTMRVASSHLSIYIPTGQLSTAPAMPAGFWLFAACVADSP